METKTRGRHRAAGKHAARQITIQELGAKPTGRRSAIKYPVAPPPKPEHAPTIQDRVMMPAVVSDGPWVWEKPTTGMIQIAKHKKPLTALAAIATGGLLVVAGGLPAQSQPAKVSRAATSTPSDLEYESQAITAPDDAVVLVEKTLVQTTPAPPPPPAPEPEPVVIAAPAVVAPPVAAPQVIAKPAGVAVPAPAPVAPAPAPVASSGKGAIIAQAAMRQLGWGQDCTALASNSLAVAGMNVPRRWPWQYADLGVDVGPANAQPGDLLLYAAQGGMPAHIAVAVGNGQAVHGGWNGNETRLWSVNVGYPAFPPYAAIRVA